MKILKEGNTKRIKKCYRCETKFVYDISEIKATGAIYCPVCEHLLFESIFDKKYKERRKKI